MLGLGLGLHQRGQGGGGGGTTLSLAGITSTGAVPALAVTHSLIRNGTFDDNSVWLKDLPPWTLNSGVANSDGTTTGSLRQSLTVAVVPGNTYRVSFDASATGALKIGVGNNNAGLTHHDVTAGANSIDVTGGSAHSELRIRVILTTEDYTGTIDNVVVNDVT